MTELPDANVVLSCGSSVKRGLGALLTDVPSTDFTRWFGFPLNLFPGYPAPLTVTIPGIKLWTPKLPFAVTADKTVNTGVAGHDGDLTVGYTTFDATITADSLIWIQADSDGQGQIRRVSSNANVAGNGLITIDGSFNPDLEGDGTFLHFTHSHEVASGSTGTTVTKTASTAVFADADDIGKFVLFYSTSGSGFAYAGVRKITDTDNANVITVDYPITVTAGMAMIVLRGAGAGGASLSTMGTNAVLQALQIRLNNAPALLTGYDYTNYDLQPAIAATALADATINCDTELYTQLRARWGTEVYGLGLQRDSCTISPYPLPAGSAFQLTQLYAWQRDLLDFGFHPSSNDGLYEALSNAIASMQTLVAADGKTFRPRLFVCLCAENDQIVSRGGDVSHLTIGQNLARLRDAVRLLVDDPKLPFIAIGPSSPDYPLQGVDSSDYPFNEAVYAQLDQLVMEDTYSELVDTQDDERYVYVSDNLHLDAQSQINLGVDTALAYDRIVDGSTLDDVAICNLALSHVGENARITSLDITIDPSAQAQLCAKFYEPAVKHLLETYSWNFATRRAELVAVTNTRTEWVYAYEAPRQMAGAISILAEGSAHDAPSQPFLKEADGAGRTIIYTDVLNATIRYNRYVSNTRKFSESFARALSWLIASDLCGPIVKGGQGRRDAVACLGMMRNFLESAAAHDGNQRKVEPWDEKEAPWMPTVPRWPGRGFDRME